jgi:hypothetical protein
MTLDEAFNSPDLFDGLMAAPLSIRYIVFWAAVEADQKRFGQKYPVQTAMREAVPDQLMASLVADQRRGVSEPASLASKPGKVPYEPVRGTGWQTDVGFPDRSRDFERMDRLVAGMVGGPNDVSKIR